VQSGVDEAEMNLFATSSVHYPGLTFVQKARKLCVKNELQGICTLATGFGRFGKSDKIPNYTAPPVCNHFAIM
jgi:adenosylmethionine-8-amino-7-oxononanoate aminotransferase